MANCPMCGEALGFLKARAADETALDELREQGQDVPQGICHGCYLEFIKPSRSNSISPPPKIPDIPIYTYAPKCFDAAQNIDLVTAHIALGTGLVTEIFSSWTDFFGSQSKTYHNKLEEAEKLCRDKLRIKAADMGADAIIGTTTTYTELTAGHGQILVCMAGTAVKKVGE